MAFRPRAAMLAAGLAVVVAAASHPAAQSSSASCDIRTSERIVAVGDVHGAYDRLVLILRATGLLDMQDRWAGGRTVLVQTGDLVDRGPDSRRVIDLMRRLEQEAERAGGRVHVLMGNHEFMRLQGDWRDVAPEEIAAFQTAESSRTRERLYVTAVENARKQAIEDRLPFDEAGFRQAFLKEVPLGLLEMREAFAPKSDYGEWLRTRDALVRINGIVFVHGGINPAAAELGCAGINDLVRRELGMASPSAEQRAGMFAASEDSPLWYRGLAGTPSPALDAELTGALKALDARAMVIGHSVTPALRITSRFAGRLLQIDTGMLGGASYPGGVPSALEIVGDTVTAVYQTSREMLAIPASR